MNTYKVKVEIFDDQGRVRFPVTISAFSWHVGAAKGAKQGLKIYKEHRKGQRVTIKSIALDIAPTLETTGKTVVTVEEIKAEKPAGVPIGLGGSGTREEAVKMLEQFYQSEILAEAILNKFGMTVGELETKLKHKRG